MTAFNIITATFVMVLVLVPSVASKFIAVGPVNVSGATLFFPITFIITDVLTDVYGYKRSRQVIWIGLASQIFTALVYWLVCILPGAPFWHDQKSYETILGVAPRITLASFLAYTSGEFANSVIISKMKYSQGGARGLQQAWRFVASTIAGEAVDSVVFLAVGFWGTMPASDLIATMLTIYLVKVVYEIVALPFSTRLANWLKTIEHTDITDTPQDTDYNPFNLQPSKVI